MMALASETARTLPKTTLTSCPVGQAFGDERPVMQLSVSHTRSVDLWPVAERGACRSICLMAETGSDETRLNKAQHPYC